MPRGYGQEALQGTQTALKAGRTHASAPRDRSSGSSWAGQLARGGGAVLTSRKSPPIDRAALARASLAAWPCQAIHLDPQRPQAGTEIRARLV